MSKRLVGLDIETVDPLLKTNGWSWKYNQGYILNTALYYADIDEVEIIAGLHNENCPFDLVDRQCENKKIIDLLQDENVSIVGANLQYDIGWLLYEYKMSTYDVKCSFIDILQAESILDEFSIHSLETVSQKYLHYGKNKSEIESWIMQNVAKTKGDFRKYLAKVPYNLLCQYVETDAKNPVKIWKKQLTLLKEQDLCKRCKLEFDCILPTLQMTMYGLPFDNERRKTNCAELIKMRDYLKQEFEEKYGYKNFNVNSSRSVATLCDKLNIPYKWKITLKGFDNEKFKDYKDIDKAYARAKRIVSSFRYVKSIPVAYVPSNMAERTCDLLQEDGFMLTCSPNVDKKFFETQRNNYEVIDVIANWKLANGIISKVLGDDFERFIGADNKIHPQFNITDTVSFRYSSKLPNSQQFPSKNSLKIGDKEFSFPQKIRTLFYAPKGCIFGKIDYGQIEYRLICNIACGKAGEEVRKQYSENPKLDFHQYVVDLTGLSRKYAKNMSFGCFEENSYYLTSKGWQKYNTEDFQPLDLNGHTQESKHFIFQDDGLRFTLSNGVQFIVNKEHLFLACESAEKEIQVKKATDMRIGDRLPLCNIESKGHTEITKEQAYLIGLYLGDGCGCKTSIQLLAHKKNTEYVKHCLKACNFSFSYREDKDLTYFTVHKESRAFFREFGTHTENKHLTDKLFTSCSETKLYLLAGLLDTGGSIQECVIRLMGTNEKLMREVALICAMLGFDCGFNVCERYKDSKPTEYIVSIYNLNNVVIPSKFRVCPKKTKIRDVKGWKPSRFGSLMQEQKYQKQYIPVVVEKIEEVKNCNFVFLNTSSNYYNAMGIATHNCSFGLGLKSMAESFGWTIEKAEEISEQYHHHMPFVQPTLELVGEIALKRGYIKTAYGSHARLPNPNKTYTMLNRYTQGSGAECLKKSIVNAYREGLWERLKVANTVHDELNMPYVPSTRQGVKDLFRMAEIMRTCMPNLRVPLEAEPEIGTDWYNVKTLREWLECKKENNDVWQKTSQEVRDFVIIAEELLKRGEINV